MELLNRNHSACYKVTYSMNERLEATITGRVQMVMFRDFTARSANRLRLLGEVKNQKDGSVQVVAEGPRVKLEQLVVQLHRGPLLARVDNVALAWKAPTGEYQTFDITYG